MSKQYYGVIKLAPHIPAWYDATNEIYLTCDGRWFKCVTDDMELKPILKGLKAGLIMWDSVGNIGTGPEDDAKMPVVTFQCHCNVDKKGFGIIEEGVLAPYEPEYDVVPNMPAPEQGEQQKGNVEIKVKQGDVEVEEVIINRGEKELELMLEVIAENCNITAANFKFDVVNNADVVEGCEGVDVVDQAIGEDGKIMIKDLAQPKDFNACEVARIKIHGQCDCEEPHAAEKEIVIKVEEAKMFFDECPIVDVYNPDELEVQGLDYIVERMNVQVGPIAKMNLDDDENAGTFQGNYILFAPKDADLKLVAWDIIDVEFTIENPGVIVVNGIEYDVQYLDLLTGKGGVKIEVQ